MKIIALEAENIKRIKAISIKPDGDVVVIGGDNGEGKTSTLDAIMYALSGKSEIPSEALRRGEESGKVTLDLGEYSVTRTFAPEGKSTLKVKGKEGGAYNQTTLNGLLGSISMDPIAFAHKKDSEQTDILRGILGLDFTALDAKRKGLYDDRVLVGREGKSLKGQLDGLVRHDDAPAEEVSMAALVEKLNAANERNRQGDQLARDVAAIQSQHDQWASAIVRAKEQIAEAQKILDNAIHHKDLALEQIVAKKKERDEFAYQDTDSIKDEIESLEITNAGVRENAKYKAAEIAVKEKGDEYRALSKAIAKIDEDKAAQLSAAQMPIEGLTLDDTGLRYKGTQFSECSGAERMRVSVAMAVAMNPKLRVFLVRDGSLMDAKSMALLSELASEHDAQVWVERVGDADEGAIIIEDGEIRQPVEAK